MTAPGGRGADRTVRTTVATPAVPPARQIDINSGSTSRTAASLLRREIIEVDVHRTHGERRR